MRSIRFRRLPSHVTWRVRPNLPSLRTVAIARAMERSFADACARPGFRLAQYSLQANHDRDALGRRMKALGARAAPARHR